MAKIRICNINIKHYELLSVTAGFGDIGFAGYWTLEIFCVQPSLMYKDFEKQ